MRARIWLLPLVVCLALWANASRALPAVVTFTNLPAAVSNTYDGVITLQIYGLTNGVTNVVVQKYLETDTNGIIDGNDLLVQQFQLAVGLASRFTNSGGATITVTNFMPGDMTSVTGAITAPLNFQDGDFVQNLAGHYFYKITSPLGQFNPVTNLFVVTNFVFDSAITGRVFEASLTSPATNALVMLFSSQSGNLNEQAGAVADSQGNFAIHAPPGNYFLTATSSNAVASLTSEISLYAGVTNGVTVSITPATTSITGRVVTSTNSSVGLPGLPGLVESTNENLSLFFSDTNGYFYSPVISSAWTAPVNGFAAAFEGYLTWQTNPLINVSNNVVNVTNAQPKENAIFYGAVTNNTGSPVPGVYMYAFDSTNHQSWGLTDQHGNYVLPALAGTNLWQVEILPANNPGLTNSYVFSPLDVQTTINTNEAIQQNFGLELAPYFISGTVEDGDGNPIGGVQVFGTVTNVNGVNYQALTTTTASDGTYTLSVCPGNWTVGLNAASLESLGYTNLPPTQSTNISNAGAVINFQIQVCGEIQIVTTNLPDAIVGLPYSTMLAANSCGSITNWTTAYGVKLTSLSDQTNIIYTNGTALYSNSGLVGYLESYFAFGFTYDVNNDPVGWLTNISGTIDYSHQDYVYFDNLSATVNVSGPIANTNSIQFDGVGTVWTLGPTTQNGSTYQAVLSLSQYKMGNTQDGHPVTYSQTNGDLITLNGGGKSNTVALVVGGFHSQIPGNVLNIGSRLPFTNMESIALWIKNGANQAQYLATAYGPQNTNLPPGLILTTSGSSTATLAGTPTGTGTNNGIFNFTVDAVDAAADSVVQPLSLLVYTNSPPLLQATNLAKSSTGFQLQINDALAGLNYTVLMSTNLASTNWTTIYTTNPPGSGILFIPDPNATNPARFYRVQVAP